MIRLADGVYQLESGGFVNSYLIAGQDLTLVDAGTDGGAEALLEELKANGFSYNDVGRVVVTHAHPDHAGGLAPLLALRPVKVYAHPSEAAYLTGRSAMPALKGLRGFLLDMAARFFYAARPVENVMPAEPGAPVRGLSQWQMLHTPGHSAGSICLYEPVRQILLCGDLLENRGGKLKPFPAWLQQDTGQLRVSLQKVARMDVDILGCGHGPVVRGGAFRHIAKLVSA